MNNKTVSTINALNTQYSTVTNSLTSNSRLLGHRGARGEFFENSHAGFEHLKQMTTHVNGKIAGIEFDIQLTEDGHLVVFHDESLWRLYGLPNRINQLGYSELNRLIAGRTNLPKMLHLADMPPLLDTYSHIELEVKTHVRTNYQQLTRALQRILTQPDFKSLPIIVTSFDTLLLAKLHSLFSSSTYEDSAVNQEAVNKSAMNQSALKESTKSSRDSMNSATVTRTIKTGLIVAPPSNNSPVNSVKVNISKSKTATRQSVKNKQLNNQNTVCNIANTAKRLGCQHISFHYSLVDAAVIEQCERYGLSHSAWTVNVLNEYDRLNEIGINYITTDFPSALLRY